MRRRDRHFTFVLVGLIFCNLITALVGIVSTRSALRRASEAAKSAEKCERSSIEASSTVVALAEQIAGSSGASSNSSDTPLDPPRVLGYGQTRSRKSVYVYRDVEYDGVVRREYVQRLPLLPSN